MNHLPSMPFARLVAAAGIVVLPLVAAPAARATEASRPVQLIEERPTLRCLGARWLIAGDSNRNARVSVRYRREGTADWRPAMDFFRIDPDGMRPDVRPGKDRTWFAGSIFNLEPGTPYDVELALHDPDGGDTNATLAMTTWTAPVLPPDGRRIDVDPSSWTQALAAAQPGDILVLAPGVYAGNVRPPSGSALAPLAILGPPDAGAILDGNGATSVIAAYGLQYVMFLHLTFRNAGYGIAVNEGSHVTVQYCRFLDVKFGFVGQRNGSDVQERFYIADNIFQGRTPWPRDARGMSGGRGIQVSGFGHVICNNRISGFDDGINTFSSPPCAAIDIYGNDITQCIDDGIEMDYSECNTRCFENRLTSVFMGISAQPVHGGPVYIFRNVLYNIRSSPFKLHNSPSGVLLLQNTSVKTGPPSSIASQVPVFNSRSRNNLYVGTGGRYVYECQPPMRDCDFDYDGFSGTCDRFLKWNDVRYATLAEAQAAGLYPHAVIVPTGQVFEDGFRMPEDADALYDPERSPPLLRPDGGAIDRGEVLPNINDAFTGTAPDLGAYECGQAVPVYGPRPP
ncbi:MAG: right-handed parallel beta-helix repeat-containing protein [Lentisphaerae bacterium]|nr:right-handed parallel beta-helix repeat-containing protein [Lentisphaerota bacterium]